MRARSFVAIVSGVLPVLFAACGARTGLIGDDPLGEAGPDVRRRDTGKDVGEEDEPLPPIVVTKKDADKTDCLDAAQTLVYAVTVKDEILSFDPATKAFKVIGTLSCPGSSGTPFSMGVDRKGTAYVLYSSGQLFKVSTATAACAATAWKPESGSFNNFGMGFATIGAGPEEELFIASIDGKLAKIDVVTFTRKDVGPFSPKLSSAELTGTGDGRLYAFYSVPTGGTGVAEVDKETGKVVGQDLLPAISMGSGWAFAFWGGDFWLFTTPGKQTTTRFDPVTKTTTTVANYTASIVGAGVSTCAPQ